MRWKDRDWRKTTYKINIQAYGIQTTDLNGGTKDAAEIWNIITNQRELTERFYLTEESDEDEKNFYP